MTSGKNKSPKDQNAAASNGYWQKKAELHEKSIKLFEQIVFQDWCKACGICIAFCPKKVFRAQKDGKPVVEHPDACNGCLFCELHCPDFAITIKERFPDRRKQLHEGKTDNR